MFAGAEIQLYRIRDTKGIHRFQWVVIVDVMKKSNQVSPADITLRAYMEREEFGVKPCCGLTEDQLNHVLNDVQDWLWYQRGQEIPAHLYEILKWIGAA